MILEQGRIKIPRNQVGALRQNIRDAANHFHYQVLTEATEFYESIPYTASVNRWLAEWKSWSAQRAFLPETNMVVHSMVEPYYLLGKKVLQKPRKPRDADVDLFAPHVNLRDLHLEYVSFVISFIDRYDIGWTVTMKDDNVRKHPVAAELFASLDAVEWTNEQGGTIRRDGNIVDAYGPVGYGEREKELQGWG